MTIAARIIGTALRVSRGRYRTGRQCPEIGLTRPLDGPLNAAWAAVIRRQGQMPVAIEHGAERLRYVAAALCRFFRVRASSM